MTLEQLKSMVDEAVLTLEQDGIDLCDIEVKLTVNKPSNGRRGAVGIRSAYLGVDFEQGEFRLDPDVALQRM